MEAFIQKGLQDRRISKKEIPIFATNMVVLACWFMLRGLEIASAILEDVTFDHNAKVVTWKLPVHKTDTTGKGTRRSHKCLCPSEGHISPICPYHAALFQKEELRKHRWTCATTPFFANSQGLELSKAAVAWTAVMAALYLQQSDIEQWNFNQLQSWAEHAFRVSGAQMLARANLELYLIQLLGRWGSRAIERYVQEAPLADVSKAAIAVAKLAANTQMSVCQDIVPQSSYTPPMAAIKDMPSADDKPHIAASPETAKLEIKKLRKLVQECLLTLHWFIRNPKSKLVHVPEPGQDGLPSDCWTTKCHRWRFANSSYIRHSCVLPDYRKCPACFDGATMPAEESTDGSSSEDDP